MSLWLGTTKPGPRGVFRSCADCDNPDMRIPQCGRYHHVLRGRVGCLVSTTRWDPHVGFVLSVVRIQNSSVQAHLINRHLVQIAGRDGVRVGCLNRFLSHPQGHELLWTTHSRDLFGRSVARADDTQGRPTQSRISPSILVYPGNRLEVPQVVWLV